MGGVGKRLARIAAATAIAVALVSCGGDGECDGFLTINAPPDECELQAERFGCSGFEVDGPTCGLFGCVRCTGDD